MMRHMLRLRQGMSACTEPMGRSVPAISGLSGRLFGGAPLVAWIAVWALKDLRRPDSKIRYLARRLTGKTGGELPLVVSVEPPAVLDGPGKLGQENKSEG